MSHAFAVRTLGLASCLLLTGCESRRSTLSVKCEPSSVRAGETVQCTARALGPFGQPLPGTPNVSWSTDPDLATVDERGKVSALRPGRVEVFATPLQQDLTVGLAHVDVLDDPNPDSIPSSPRESPPR